MDANMPWIDCTLTRGPIRGKSRNTIGLILRVQARNEVEEFMRNLSNGQKMETDQYPGDPWTLIGESKNLELYDVGGIVHRPQGYAFDGPNSGLLSKSAESRAIRNGGELDTANLSFLSVVGLSEGVSIGIPGAYSTEYITKFRSLLPQAVKKFLADYLVPVSISLQVISRG